MVLLTTGTRLAMGSLLASSYYWNGMFDYYRHTDMVTTHRFFYPLLAALYLLISACSDGDGVFTPPENDSENCSSTLNTSTSPGIEVDINGNITQISTPTSTVSDCGSSGGTALDDTSHLDSARVVTRFITNEDYDIWDCNRTDGTSLHYALLSYDNFGQTASRNRYYGIELDPSAADPYGSQQLYAWRAPLSSTADNLTFWTQERVGTYTQGIESAWTNITFSTADTMSVDSSTQGVMQCNRSVGIIALAASRFDFPCKYRGPIFAC